MIKPIDPQLIIFARELRKNATDAEQFLWQILRARRFAGYKFRRQHPIAHYFVDFYCHELGLVVELDGGQHANEENRGNDEQRTACLNTLGLKVIRYWNHDVLNESEALLTHLWQSIQQMNSAKMSGSMQDLQD